MVSICILKPKEKSSLTQQTFHLLLTTPPGRDSPQLGATEKTKGCSWELAPTAKMMEWNIAGIHQAQRRERRRGIQEGRQGKELGLSREGRS